MSLSLSLVVWAPIDIKMQRNVTHKPATFHHRRTAWGVLRGRAGPTLERP
jgi:hypothetical protein